MNCNVLIILNCAVAQRLNQGFVIPVLSPNLLVAQQTVPISTLFQLNRAHTLSEYLKATIYYSSNMIVNKKFDRLKQWTNEKLGASEVKTSLSDDFKSLEAEMQLKFDG